MPYDPLLVQPMREELTQIGVQELLTAQDVDSFLGDKAGTAMIVVNSVCGCAAGQARPGVALALQHDHKPEKVGTVFAGQDLEATSKARSLFADYPPSSPSIVLFKDGKVVHFVPRHQIENRDAGSLAAELTAAFDKHCASATSR
jgi:putative YphP/YqiW family bacilliredoxin